MPHKTETDYSDALPAFETKDHKTVSNPIEACIVAEVSFLGYLLLDNLHVSKVQAWLQDPD